jgi:hypothetical protein
VTCQGLTISSQPSRPAKKKSTHCPVKKEESPSPEPVVIPRRQKFNDEDGDRLLTILEEVLPTSRRIWAEEIAPMYNERSVELGRKPREVGFLKHWYARAAAWCHSRKPPPTEDKNLLQRASAIETKAIEVMIGPPIVICDNVGEVYDDDEDEGEDHSVEEYKEREQEEQERGEEEIKAEFWDKIQPILPKLIRELDDKDTKIQKLQAAMDDMVVSLRKQDRRWEEFYEKREKHAEKMRAIWEESLRQWEERQSKWEGRNAVLEKRNAVLERDNAMLAAELQRMRAKIASYQSLHGNP